MEGELDLNNPAVLSFLMKIQETHGKLRHEAGGAPLNADSILEGTSLWGEDGEVRQKKSITCTVFCYCDIEIEFWIRVLVSNKEIAHERGISFCTRRYHVCVRDGHMVSVTEK